MDEFELVFFDFGFGDGAGGCWGWDVVIDIICRVIFSSFSVLFIFFAVVVFILR